MIINRTVRWLDCWILKLEYANQGIDALIKGQTTDCVDQYTISRAISEVYGEIRNHRWQYLGIGWSLFERPLLTRSTLECLDYCDYRLKVIDEELLPPKADIFVSIEKLKKLEQTILEIIERLELEQNYYLQPWWERWKKNDGFIGFVLSGIHRAIDEKMAWNEITRRCFNGWINQISSCSQDLYRLRHNPDDALCLLSEISSTLWSVENELSCLQYYFGFPWWKRFRLYENIGKETISCFDNWIMDIENIAKLTCSAAYDKDFSKIPEKTNKMGGKLRVLASDMRSHLERYSVPWYMRWLEEPEAYGKR